MNVAPGGMQSNEFVAKIQIIQVENVWNLSDDLLADIITTLKIWDSIGK